LNVDRRLFLQGLGAGALAYLHGRLPVRADALDIPNFDPHMPADKGLKSDWVKSLFERGTPAVYSKDDLRTIQMPDLGYLHQARNSTFPAQARSPAGVCTGHHWKTPCRDSRCAIHVIAKGHLHGVLLIIGRRGDRKRVECGYSGGTPDRR
jgi:hypothetical protein